MNRSETSERRMPGPPGINIMEAYFQLEDYRTANKRPLAELAASPEIIEQAQSNGIDMSLSLCGYSGSRKGFQMEHAPFREMIAHWQEILDGFAWINNGYFNGRTVDNVSIGDVRQLTDIALALPDYLVMRTEDPFEDGTIPDITGYLSKSARGIAACVFDLPPSADTVVVTPNFLYEVADGQKRNVKTRKERVLLVRDGIACPAPKNRITEAMDALFYQKRADWKRSELQDLVTDFPTLKNFAALSGQFQKMIIKSDGDILEQDLPQFSLLQTKLNAVLGRDPSNAIPIEDQLSRLGIQPISILE